MSSEDIKKAITSAVTEHGKNAVIGALTVAGVGPSTSEKLAAGGSRYPHEIGVLMGAAIQRGLATLKKAAS